MRQEKDIQITRGVLITLWRLIYFTEKYKNPAVKAAVNIIKNVALFGGKVPIHQALKAAQLYKFAEIVDNSIVLTQFCKNEVVMVCDEEEPNIKALRGMLSRIIVIGNCHWVLYFNEDVEIFRTAIPHDWIDLLESAQLLDLMDREVLEWWNRVFSEHHQYAEDKKKAIGDVGEELTFDFEINRLLDDRVERPNLFVKWASKFSNEFGFDILSIRGNLLQFQKYFSDAIQIEVKASVISDESAFRFKISKNEWNTALKNMESYYFYCWLGVNLAEGKAISGPFLVSVESLMDYVPRDTQNDVCEWTECRFLIDLNKHGRRLG